MKRIELEDGGICDLHERWITPERAVACMDSLLTEVPWAQREIELYGRKVMQPRLVAWIGDADAVYTYSRTRHVPLPWTETLSGLRDTLQRSLGLSLNSVLCNLYRDGQDSMGMHSDSEPELGENPVVVSLSLGVTRTFRLRHRDRRRSKRDLDLALTSGSLLVMSGTTQHFYRHGVPRQRSATGPRINLTFRRVLGG